MISAGEAVAMFAELVDALDKGPVSTPPETHRKLVEAVKVLRSEIAETIG